MTGRLFVVPQKLAAADATGLGLAGYLLRYLPFYEPDVHVSQMREELREGSLFNSPDKPVVLVNCWIMSFYSRETS